MTQEQYLKKDRDLKAEIFAINQRKNELDKEFINANKLREVGATITLHDKRWIIQRMIVERSLQDRVKVVYLCALETKTGAPSKKTTAKLTNDHIGIEEGTFKF